MTDLPPYQNPPSGQPGQTPQPAPQPMPGAQPMPGGAQPQQAQQQGGGQPQMSPDGNYWWDGRQWVPVQHQQQPQQQPAAYQQPGAYPQPGGYPQPGAYPQPGGYPQPGYGAPVMGERKSAGLHLLASFFIPGLGTIIAGRVGRGVAILGAYVAVWIIGFIIIGATAASVATNCDPTTGYCSVSNAGAFAGGAIIGFLVMFVGALAIWIFGMVDAYQSANKWNREHGYPY